MIGTLKDLTMNRDGTQNVTFTVQGDFRGTFDKFSGKPLDIGVKVHREKRSLDANAYFHHLVNEIAKALNESDERVKRQLVIDYGVIEKDRDGKPFVLILPSGADVDRVWKYTRLFRTCADRENKILLNYFLVFKASHEMTTAEMARLIDGAVSEAKELGIETLTPAELAAMKGA